MVVSLTRKIVTATESKAQAYRVGLPRPPRRRPHPPTRRRRGLYGSVGASYGALAGTAVAASHALCHAPAAMARPPTAPTQVATARWRVLPRRAPTHNAIRRPPWRTRQPRLRRSVGVGRGRGLVAVYGLFRSIWLLSGFGSPHA